ncbi:MAG TPA: aminomethyltransferase family protein, partial [Candidatus Limnocylindrales bacterium]|nr:aminomethyltransferase family protein [Candidatus Limnocylindrales bacterium]
FGKIEVSGAGALVLLQRVAVNDIDRPVGSAVYTQWLDRWGGIVADVTVTRLAPDRFRVLTGAGYLAADLGWLRSAASDNAGSAGDVEIADVTERWAVLGLWGPRARDVLGRATDDAVDDRALPLRRARGIRIGSAPVLATRLSYAGELGWELTVAPEWAVPAWDRLVAAGADDGLEPIGYRALESLRLEKGYRYFGAELTPRETPYEAGLGAFVRLGKGEFIGRSALLEAGAPDTQPRRRLRTVLLGGAEWLPVYGGEAVRLEGGVVGRLRSAAFGHTVRRTVGTVYLPAEVAEGAPLEVDVFADRVAGSVAADVLVDPTGARMRG